MRSSYLAFEEEIRPRRLIDGPPVQAPRRTRRQRRRPELRAVRAAAAWLQRLVRPRPAGTSSTGTTAHVR